MLKRLLSNLAILIVSVLTVQLYERLSILKEVQDSNSMATNYRYFSNTLTVVGLEKTSSGYRRHCYVSSRHACSYSITSSCKNESLTSTATSILELIPAPGGSRFLATPMTAAMWTSLTRC